MCSTGLILPQNVGQSSCHSYDYMTISKSKPFPHFLSPSVFDSLYHDQNHAGTTWLELGDVKLSCLHSVHSVALPYFTLALPACRGLGTRLELVVAWVRG